MEISCEPIKFSCIKPPTAKDISELKSADLVPDSLITKIFNGLATDYKSLKKKSPTKSKSTSRTGTSRTGKSKTKGGRKRKGKRMTKKMRGGALSDFQKNRIVDMVILLVAGSVATAGSYWSVATALESYIVSIGILPKLCGQSMLEHAMSNMASMSFGSESCATRETRYSAIVNSVVASITVAGYFSREMFSKRNIAKNYAKIHKRVKHTLFASDGVMSPSPDRSPTPAPSAPVAAVASRRRTPSPTGKKATGKKGTGQQDYPPQFRSREEEEAYYAEQQGQRR
jgi:hypothetical protein